MAGFCFDGRWADKGQLAEARRIAAKEGLSNITALIDYNVFRSRPNRRSNAGRCESLVGS